jgi:TonB family protein
VKDTVGIRAITATVRIELSTTQVYALGSYLGGSHMRRLAHLLAICLAGSLVASTSAQTQKEITDPQVIASAKTIYFQDDSGADAVGKKASAELGKWARFQIVRNPQKADLTLLLTTDPGQGGDLILAGGQTASIDPDGHVEEDRVPTFNKLEPVKYAFLIVKNAKSGDTIWIDSSRWGGLLTGFDSVGERLVKEFEKQAEAADQSARLKLLKSVNPIYPPDAQHKQIEGTVVVRIVVDKNGTVSSAKAISGPPELFQASLDAMKQWQFEPPEHPPVTKEMEISYGVEPTPCPPGRTGTHPSVSTAFRPPMKTGRPGELKLLDEIHAPLPPYPDKARDAGIEGDLELYITVAPNGEVVGVRVVKAVVPMIDDTAVATVRTWKFKVSRGDQAGFTLKLRFELTCFSSDDR